MVRYYDDKKGRIGTSIRTVVALLILSKFKTLSDEQVISEVKENPYMQYFCNVPDEGLMAFMHPSNLSKLRKRFGVEGMEVIESSVFDVFRIAGVVKNDSMLIDSTVLPNNIVYPTDVGLIVKAFKKMNQFAQKYQIPVWWDEQEVQQLWREYNLDRKQIKIIEIFFELILTFSSALREFEKIVETIQLSDKEK